MAVQPNNRKPEQNPTAGKIVRTPAPDAVDFDFSAVWRRPRPERPAESLMVLAGARLGKSLGFQSPSISGGQ